MSEEILDRTLSKNKLKEFIIRINFAKSGIEINKIAEKLSTEFDTVEKRQISGVKIQFTNNESKFTDDTSFDYVLNSKQKNIVMVFSENQNAFWITSGQYKSNTIYKEIIKRTIEVINGLDLDIEANRIGLRYVNQFECGSKNFISRTYGTRLSSVIKGMINTERQSRIIGVEEYNFDDYKIRLQYGIPNKFYPSIMRVFDLILDIDAFSEKTCKTDEWEHTISQLNHAAYEMFMKEMNSKYIEGLK